eukprot:11756744-Karenia_brevis.AAC.1
MKKSRSLRRLVRQKKWGEDNLKLVTWAPWKRHEGDEEADGDVPDGVTDEERKKERDIRVDQESESSNRERESSCNSERQSAKRV